MNTSRDIDSCRIPRGKVYTPSSNRSSENASKLRRYIPLFRASALRVLLEVFIVQAILTIVYPLIFSSAPSEIHFPKSMSLAQQQEARTMILNVTYSFFVGVLSTVWAVLRWRLRPAQRSRRRQLFYEIGMSTIFVLELILCRSILGIGLMGVSRFTFLTSLSDFTYPHILIAPLSACVFFCLRLGVYALLLWNRLRKAHIRWALTHAHLMVVVVGAAVIYLVFIPFFIIQNVESIGYNSLPLYALLGRTFVALCIIIFLVVVGVLVVLPPSALFSYLFARRLVRRIENLARGAGELRAGNYSVRVPVEGKDEVARLQTDFNAMAADLERTLHELKEERDNVGTLLNARRELVASVSHELRTPVATIRSYLESALMGWQEQPPETLRQDLQVMEQQMIRLQSLINDLFTLSRAEVGRLEMRCQPTNVALLVERVAETISPVAWRGSRIEVIADIESSEAEFPHALVDESRLEQVLQNLLHNGIRHTSPGGIIILSAHAEAKMIVLQVKDTGEGIVPEELNHIWDRFYRVEGTRNKSGSGSGLGLAIVKELTEAMGGTVAVTSVVGEGSCFSIFVPRVDAVATGPLGLGVGLFGEKVQEVKGGRV
jgi:signal transduction histidine kinase